MDPLGWLMLVQVELRTNAATDPALAQRCPAPGPTLLVSRPRSGLTDKATDEATDKQIGHGATGLIYRGLLGSASTELQVYRLQSGPLKIKLRTGNSPKEAA